MNAPHANIITTPAESLRAEIVVIGSGPGGAVTACLLAEAGRDIVILEEGPYHPLESCTPFSSGEMLQKYRNGGVTVALGRPKVAYAEGRCVGGGSEINSGLYHRTPPDVLDEWRRDFAVDALTEADLRPQFEANERDLGVCLSPGAPAPASLKLHEGASKLGWKSVEVPRWFRYEPGANPPRGTRQSMTKTFIPRALQAGARLVPDTRAARLRRVGNRWQIDAQCHHQPMRIEAEHVFVACGAIQTPALLRRSGFKRNVGDNLHMHPTVKVVARFPGEVNALDMGVPSHQVKEFSPRFSFGCSISSPAHLALAMIDHEDGLREVDGLWRRMATYYAMTRGGVGTVRPLPFSTDPLVRYRLNNTDLGDLTEALRHLCQCLLAAGAERLYLSVAGVPCLRGGSDLNRLPQTLSADRTSLMSIHLFSSCPMGNNRARSAVDSFGNVHDAVGLHVADASLLCGPPGVNPQGSIMAIVRRNALKFLGKL